jgi:3-hydroxyisobutyrate dehydrogenase
MAAQQDPLTPPATVGMLGIGQMGLPMALRLQRAGYTVRCYDADPKARGRADAQGLSVVGTPAQVQSGAKALLLSLPSSDVVEEVLLGAGLLDTAAPGTILVDMGSSRPASTRELGDRLTAREVGYVDAPVSGGVSGAETGSLTIMVGGPEWAVTLVRPALDVIGSKVLYVGGTGAGHALKALNNLLSATHMLATSEAMRIGEAFGLDPETMLDALNSSTGRSGSTEVKWPKYVLSNGYDSGFALRLMLKDMRIAVELAADTGRPVALGETAVRLWDQAAQALPSDADHTEIVRWLDDLATKRLSDSHSV